MEMVRDIDEDTVDFQDNYDGRTQRARRSCRRASRTCWSTAPSASRSAWRPTSRRTTCARSPSGAQWYLENPEATREELLEALIQRIKGPDFPTGAQILGVKGIQDAYRTGRGSITMRAVVNVEEIQGRTCLVVTELPYQVNPDNLAIKIAELVKDGKHRRHRRHPRRDLGPHRPAPRHRAQARRRREGRAEQPLQAHAAAGELRREHARDRRRRARARSPLDGFITALGRPPDRRHRPPHAVPAAQGRGAMPTSCAATSRRSTRSTRSSRSSAAPRPSRTPATA